VDGIDFIFVFFVELLLGFDQLLLKSDLSLLFFLDKAVTHGEGQLSLGFSVGDLILSHFQAQCQPFVEATDVKATLGLNVF
jgi:hypothetical protein